MKIGMLNRLEVQCGPKTFRAVAREPYITAQGELVDLIVWESECHDCGAPFHIKTTVNFTNFNAFQLRRCELHRKSEKGKKLRIRNKLQMQLATRSATCCNKLQGQAVQLLCNSATPL